MQLMIQKIKFTKPPAQCFSEIAAELDPGILDQVPKFMQATVVPAILRNSPIAMYTIIATR